MIEEKFYQKYFKNKKITLVGLGGLGRGVIEAKFLAKNEADLIITDLSDEKKLEKEIFKLKKFKNIKYTLGKHKISDFRNRDLVIYANGTSLKNKYIEEAKKSSKITIKSAALLFLILEKEFGDKILKIGITGSKGKSTTTEMIKNLLNFHCIENKKKQSVFSAGNLRGSSNLPILEKIKSEDFLVAELDSWSLQGFGNIKLSPNISIFTNFFNDHQNYYHSMEKYFKDKSFIFKFQNKNDFFIFDKNTKKEIKKYFDWKKICSKKICSNFKKNPNWNYNVFGEHNQKNIASTLMVAEILKISKKIQKEAMEKFQAVEGRMEFLGKKKEILFFNDNNSTTPDSTIANIKALKEKFPKSNIFLLGGGANKKLKFENISEIIEKNISFVSLFSGEGSDKIISSFSKKFQSFEISTSMKKSFKKLCEQAKKNDIIILSPGTSSFGVFKNEYDRNDQFLKEYKKL